MNNITCNIYRRMEEVMNKKNWNHYKIVLVGVGGTGGLLSTLLCRYIYSIEHSRENISFSLCIIDADRVEEKNIGRQPFSKDDLGQFKVDALQEAYSYLYGTDISSMPSYVNNIDDIYNAFNTLVLSSEKFGYNMYNHKILIGAVDNHRARQVMEEYFITYNECEPLIYIDSANEYDFGTCICGYRKGNNVYSPTRGVFFSEVFEDNGPSASEMSCGEMNISSPQHLLTNITAANVIFSHICNYIDNNSVSSGVTYFFPFKNKIEHHDLDNYYGIKSESVPEIYRNLMINRGIN